MEETFTLLAFLSEHPEIMGFVQNMGIATLVGILILPKSIDAWRHLKNHDEAHGKTDTNTQHLVQQMSEQVNLCSEATREAVHKIAENTDDLLQVTTVLTELLQATDIKSLSAMLRKAISDMESLVITGDHHTEKLGDMLNIGRDILRLSTELLDMHKDPNSPFATGEAERQLDMIKQLINDLTKEVVRLSR